MRSILALVVVALVVLAAACSPAPRQIGTVFPADGLGGRPGVPVDVVDPGGLVDSIAVGAPTSVGDLDPHGGIVAVSGWPDAAVVWWTGGPCDIRTTVTVGARDASIAVRLRTTHRAGPCNDMGIRRTVTLVFVAPITARSLEWELDPTR